MNATRTRTARATARCPRHPDTVLDEGPVQYRCPHGHRVQAADISKEVTR
ncbi:MAG TPA: hypothetical protein VHA75_04580 [Rugosimonospora sp.]|nr:hypothetical protein [Rugosimonospora sp.]